VDTVYKTVTEGEGLRWRHQERGVMVELLRSNDPVLISFAASLLEDAKIGHSVADSHMSVIEGSIGAVTNRVFVAEDQYAAARALLADAGVALGA
jgi:hypothetical protein